MLKLLKYEWLRRQRLLIGAALTVLFVEGVTLYSIWRGGNWNILAICLTVVLFIGGLLLPLLDTVTQYYSDYKQKHGYMLFMTPQSGFSILWSKAFFAFMELVASVILLGACVGLSGLYANYMNNGAILDIMHSIRAEWMQQFGNTGSMTGLIAAFSLAGMLQIYTQISIAVLALTVSKALLPGNSYNWLIALAMYFALAIGINMVNGGLLALFGLIGDIRLLEANGANILGFMFKYAAIGISAYVVWSVGAITLSGYLVKRGVDL